MAVSIALFINCLNLKAVGMVFSKRINGYMKRTEYYSALERSGLSMVSHTFNFSTQVAEAQRSLGIQGQPDLQRIPRQPELYDETLSKTN